MLIRLLLIVPSRRAGFDPSPGGGIARVSQQQ